LKITQMFGMVYLSIQFSNIASVQSGH